MLGGCRPMSQTQADSEDRAAFQRTSCRVLAEPLGLKNRRTPGKKRLSSEKNSGEMQQGGRERRCLKKSKKPNDDNFI